MRVVLGADHAGFEMKQDLVSYVRSLGHDVLDVPGLWSGMVRACRNLGRPGVVSMAVAAVDIALWDLKAKLLDLPLCRLLGQVRPAVPVYGRGGLPPSAQPTGESRHRA